MQTEAQENKIQEKDNEVLRLLNQIATDMIRKSDVDRLTEEAVNKATSALKAEYEDRMKAMAAEYEAKIAEIQNRKEDDKGNGKDQTPGKSTKNARKKGNSIICSTKEEAMQRLQEEMNKAAIMQDQAFGKGSEKLSSEQKAAIDPINGDADDDSQVKAAVSPCGDYGLCEYDPKARSNEYSNYIKVDAEDESLVDCYPVGCNKESKTGIALRFLERIRIIYKFEKSFKKLSDEERQKERATNVIPILNDMYNDLLYYSKQAAGKCGELLLKAINYAMAEWKGLIKYTMDGRYRADNNYAYHNA